MTRRGRVELFSGPPVAEEFSRRLRRLEAVIDLMKTKVSNGLMSPQAASEHVREILELEVLMRPLRWPVDRRVGSATTVLQASDYVVGYRCSPYAGDSRLWLLGLPGAEGLSGAPYVSGRMSPWVRSIVSGFDSMLQPSSPCRGWHRSCLGVYADVRADEGVPSKKRRAVLSDRLDETEAAIAVAARRMQEASERFVFSARSMSL